MGWRRRRDKENRNEAENKQGYRKREERHEQVRDWSEVGTKVSGKSRGRRKRRGKRMDGVSDNDRGDGRRRGRPAHRDLCMVIPLLAKTLTENFPSTS